MGSGTRTAAVLVQELPTYLRWIVPAVAAERNPAGTAYSDQMPAVGSDLGPVDVEQSAAVVAD